MKLSNKVLCGFFGIIFIYLTAIFAELRLSGTPTTLGESNSIAERVDLSGFNYLILENMDIDVIGSDRSELEVLSFSGDALSKLMYQLRGDTLILSSPRLENNRSVRISLFVPRSGLQRIILDHSVASIKGLQQPHLHISQISARLWMSDNDIGRLQFDASKQSFFEITSMELDTLSATFEESQVILSAPVKRLDGSMKERSILYLHDVDDIQFRKDETCRLSLYP